MIYLEQEIELRLAEFQRLTGKGNVKDSAESLYEIIRIMLVLIAQSKPSSPRPEADAVFALQDQPGGDMKPTPLDDLLTAIRTGQPLGGEDIGIASAAGTPEGPSEGTGEGTWAMQAEEVHQAHDGQHDAPHEGLPGMPHAAPHEAPHDMLHGMLHDGSQATPHEDPLKALHDGPHEGPREEPHAAPHEAPHAMTHEMPHEAPHAATHEEHHEEPQDHGDADQQRRNRPSRKK